MGQQMMSDGARRNNFGTHSKSINSTALMNQMRWLHVTALVTRLTRQGLCEDGIVRALTSFYPQYASLIEDLNQTPYGLASWIKTSFQTHDQVAAMHKVNVVHSVDGQWICHYEYPHEAVAVHSDDSPFVVHAAEHATFGLCPDISNVQCLDQAGTALLQITGDCASVTAVRGEVEILGRSLGDETGFFLAALQEGKAIRVTTHDGSQSRVYLFMDEMINEIDIAHWQDNFAPFLLPLD